MAKRSTPSVQDQGSIDSTIYNKQAGAQKNAEVGRHLLPLNSSATAFTTDATTARALPSKGKNIAVYNNAGAVGAVTLGTDNTVAALAPGVTAADGSVGIPCAPNDWTYIACFDKQWIRSTAATLLVFVIADDSIVT